MPVIFIGHGSPMNALQNNRWTQNWRQIARDMPRPRAILAVSAHWYVGETAVTAMASPRTIHDFGGFPPELYAARYPAPGEPALAAQVCDLLADYAVRLDLEWGLDHGSWSILMHWYPNADVPVIQLSMDVGLTPRACYELGVRLRPLRDAGVLLLGSGNVVHNLREIDWSDRAVARPWALEFEQLVSDALLHGDVAALTNVADFGAAARRSVPTPEHYLPLLYLLGAAHQGEVWSIPARGIDMGSISMLCARLG